MNLEFWRGRRVFITGHTGFRGSHLADTLKKAGASVFGYSLNPATTPNFFEVANVGQGMNSTFGDVRDLAQLKSALEYSEAEVVFHLAGGGGLKESWDKTAEVYSTQVLGTVNLFEYLKETATVRAAVVLSSDKVYRKQDHPILETDPLAGSAPIATAKACADLVLESYLSGPFAPEKYNKHKIALASARMGAVIGGGDFAAESLMWQLAQACQAGVDLPLKNPNSLRPWMHVDDGVNGLLLLAQSLIEKGPKASGAWNFGAGPENQASVGQVVSQFYTAYLGRSPLNEALANSYSVHGLLDSRAAHAGLGWNPGKNAAQTVRETAQWYKSYFK